MKSVIILKDRNEHLKNLLMSAKVEFEFLNSVSALFNRYSEKSVRLKTIVITDTVFSNEHNIYNDLESINLLMSQITFKFEKIIFITSNDPQTSELVNMIRTTLGYSSETGELDDKIEIRQLPGQIDIGEVYNAVLNKSLSKEDIVSVYEHVIKAPRGADITKLMNREITNRARLAGDGSMVLQTLDVKGLAQFAAIREYYATSKSPNKKTPKDTVTNISPVSKELLLDIIEPIEQPKERLKKRILITGERSSGKLTVTGALMTSVFQLGNSVLVYDLTDNSTLIELGRTGIDVAIGNVSSMFGSTENLNKTCDNLRSKSVSIVSGGTNDVLEFSNMNDEIHLLNFDVEIFVINVTKMEMVRFEDFDRIIAVTGNKPKYILSLLKILTEKFQSLTSAINLLIFQSYIYSTSSEIVYTENEISNGLDLMIDAVTKGGLFESSVKYFSEAVVITDLNMEGQFAIDLLGGDF